MAQEGDFIAQQKQMDKEEEERLKYLEFIQVATVHVVLYLTNLYGYAKDKSGPLKPSVETVEGTVKTVVGPVYHKFHGVPIHLLKYVDRKVDASVAELDRRVPPTVKQVSTQALAAAQKAPEVARSMASEVQRSGVVDAASGIAKTVYTKCEPAAKGLYAKYEPAAKGLYAKYEPAAKGLYAKYEPKAEQCAASAWRRLNQLPLFPRVANVVVPTAAFCSEKYNQTVASTAEKGYKVSSYLPLVPVERIARVFGENGGVPSHGEADVAVH